MKNFLYPLVVVLFFGLTQCSDDKNEPAPFEPTSESFLPMAVGNYWKRNDENFTQIVNDTLLEGELYYEFETVIGGDLITTQLMRIDDQNNLVERTVRTPILYFLIAKFDATEGEEFFTRGDMSFTDEKVIVDHKSQDTVTFAYQFISPSNTDKEIRKVSYRRGLGEIGPWREVNIDGVVHRF